MDENHIGPKYQYHPCADIYQRWPEPKWVKSASTMGRSLVPGQAIFVLTVRMRDAMEIFYSWFLLLFCALILSPLLGTPENAGVM